MIHNQGLNTTRAANYSVTQRLYSVPKPCLVMKRIGTAVMGKWIVMHRGSPLTVSGKESKLRVCCKQHYLVVIKKYSSQKPVKDALCIYHTFYRSMQVLCAQIKAWIFFKPSCCCCFSSGEFNPCLVLSLAVARQDTWHHVMSSLPTAPDIWRARYLFGVGNASASLFDASLCSSHIKIAERRSLADFPPITARPVGELVNLQIGLNRLKIL